MFVLNITVNEFTCNHGGAWWLSGRVSDSGARGRGFETYCRRVVSLSKTLYSPEVLVIYEVNPTVFDWIHFILAGSEDIHKSGGSVPT